MLDWNLIIVAVITAIPSTLAAVAALRASRKTERVQQAVEAVHAEVKPDNGLSAGATSDAILTKLIQGEARGDRSVRDVAHMEAMGKLDPALREREREQSDSD